MEHAFKQLNALVKKVNFYIFINYNLVGLVGDYNPN